MKRKHAVRRLGVRRERLLDDARDVVWQIIHYVCSVVFYTSVRCNRSRKRSRLSILSMYNIVAAPGALSRARAAVVPAKAGFRAKAVLAQR